MPPAGSKGSLSRGRFLPPLLLAAQVLLLSLATASWWAARHNSLFWNDRWIVGKDTGKYVFYSYEFMFQPLDQSAVDLTSFVGFQEILYRAPEGPDRALTGLSCEVNIARNGYLWLELRKAGDRFLGFRLSGKEGYPGGFYRFDDGGEIVEHRPWDGGDGETGRGWQRLEITLRGGQWRVRLAGRSLGSFPDAGPRDGRLGFRGSGMPYSKVLVREIALDFADPREPGRNWMERENFAPGHRGAPFRLAVLLFALAVLLLRSWGRGLILRHAPGAGKGAFRTASDLCLAALLLIVCLLPTRASGLQIPAVFLLSALADIILAAAAGGGERRLDGRVFAWRVLALGLLLSGLSAWAVACHGSWLLRQERTGAPILKHVHPDAYLVSPSGGPSKQPLMIHGPIRIAPGEPFFTGDHVFREQAIKADLLVPAGATLDVVFQQQSFRTKGDPEGEELPYRRRLLRLSAAPRAASGLATGTGNRPAPFRKLAMRVRPGASSRLEVIASGGRVTVRLDGGERVYRGVESLGPGETGFMAYDGEVIVENLSVTPLAAPLIGGRFRFAAGLLLPLAAAVLFWLILGISGAVPFIRAAALALAASGPLQVYLIGSLFLNSGDLALLGRDRMAWLDLLLAAACLSGIAATVLLKRALKGAPLLFNALLCVFVACAALFVWDVLPSNHPLRLKFAGESEAPGELLPGGRGKRAPWYADMRAIGANTYTWKQRFGGRIVPRLKPGGEFRIMLVGGSQAWGDGAGSTEETFAALLEKGLRAGGLPVTVCNAGVNGAGISKILDLYRGLLRQFKPDMLLCDIGLNDSAALLQKGKKQESLMRIYLQEFEELVRLCREDGVEVVLVPEPICGESPLRPFKAYYDGLEGLAAGRGLAVPDPGSAIAAKEKDHLVWWDTAHFAPYGHRLMAAALEEGVARAVRRRLPPAQ